MTVVWVLFIRVVLMYVVITSLRNLYPMTVVWVLLVQVVLMYVVITSLEKSVSYDSCLSTFYTSTSYVRITSLDESVFCDTCSWPSFPWKLLGQGTQQERNSEEWRNRIYSTRRRLKGAQDNRKWGGKDERFFFKGGKHKMREEWRGSLYQDLCL